MLTRARAAARVRLHRGALAGDTDYHGVRLLAHRIETALLWVLGLRPRAHRGEGICTFLVATAA